MVDPMTRYREALAAFAAPGGRWANKGALTYWGKAAGLTADEIISDAHAAGVADRDADLRRGWEDARPKYINGKPTADFIPRAQKPKPPQHADRVRGLIAVGRDGDTFADLRALSPWFAFFAPPRRQAADFLRAAFAPGEVLYRFTNGTRADGTGYATPGIRGKSVRTCAEWLRAVESGADVPLDHIVPNPLTGEEGRTKDGRPSLVAADCLAAFPFLIVEFDELPLADQCRFWCGFIQASRLAPALVSLVFSGNRSIHGLLHVGCRTRAEWDAARERLAALLATDPDPRFRADRQAMMPRQGVRLPGVRRTDNGRVQPLLYLNPRARAHTHTRTDAETGA